MRNTIMKISLTLAVALFTGAAEVTALIFASSQRQAEGASAKDPASSDTAGQASGKAPPIPNASSPDVNGHPQTPQT